MLPKELNALRALIVAERVARAVVIAAHASLSAESSTIVLERDLLVVRSTRHESTLTEIWRPHFGRKSDSITEDQLVLALEDLATSLAKEEALDEIYRVRHMGAQLKGMRTLTRPPVA
jgi:hypothetical protein